MSNSILIPAVEAREISASMVRIPDITVFLKEISKNITIACQEGKTKIEISVPRGDLTVRQCDIFYGKISEALIDAGYKVNFYQYSPLMTVQW